MNAVRTLDVGHLPTSARWGRSTFDLASLIYDAQPFIMGMQAAGLLRETDSFGFAMANPAMMHFADPSDVWDNPRNLVWFVAGWGPAREMLIANAVRKLRAAVREMTCTLNLVGTKVEDGFVLDQSKFEDIVQAQEPDGSFAWGDFPYGGAVLMTIDERPYFGAASALNQIHDDGIAGFLTSLVARKVAEIEESPLGNF